MGKSIHCLMKKGILQLPDWYSRSVSRDTRAGDGWDDQEIAKGVCKVYVAWPVS